MWAQSCPSWAYLSSGIASGTPAPCSCCRTPLGGWVLVGMDGRGRHRRPGPKEIWTQPTTPTCLQVSAVHVQHGPTHWEVPYWRASQEVSQCPLTRFTSPFDVTNTCLLLSSEHPPCVCR